MTMILRCTCDNSWSCDFCRRVEKHITEMEHKHNASIEKETYLKAMDDFLYGMENAYSEMLEEAKEVDSN